MTKVIVLGAGFGGLYIALNLKQLLRRDMPAEITVLGEENFFLFTPMLPEVVTGEVEPSHTLAAVRSFLRDKRFVFHQSVTAEVDFGGKVVTAFCEKGHCLHLPYDYLVIAVGSKAGLPDSIPQGEEQWVFPLKTLSDALVLHNQVLDMFEHAEMLERDDPGRKEMLTFVVVGGGFAGVETAAVLHDMIFSTLLRQYPHINANEVRVVLSHGGDQILPELSKELADYAARFLAQKRIEIKLKTLASLSAYGTVVVGAENIPTRTLIWTAGTAPRQFVEELFFEKDKGGRILTDSFGRILGYTDIFALGDCTHQENAETGQPYPPTAQVAMRQAKLVARNIIATIDQKELLPFIFSPAGMVVPLGHRRAAAIVKGFKLRGFLAWWFSRTLYLLRLPTWSNKIRVALDWMLDLFFPKDTTRITIR